MRVPSVAQRIIGVPGLPRRPAVHRRVEGAAGWWPWLLRLVIVLLIVLWLLGVAWVVPVY